MPRLFAIDPGAYKGKATCGIAELDLRPLVFDAQPAGDLLRTWSIDGTDLAAVGRVVREAQACGASILIERQFPSTRTSSNPIDMEKVVEARVKFEVLAAITRVVCELVYPATWQTILSLVPLTPAVGKTSKKTGKLIRDTKKSAEVLAKMIYPGAVLGKHERDAALMGRWYAVRNGAKE